MAAPSSPSIGSLRSYIVGDDVRLAGLVVGFVGVGAAVSLGLLPLLGDSGESLLMTVAFAVLPGVGGALCGWYRLGAGAAGGVGIAPGIVMYLFQVALGTDGDLSKIGFSFMLTTVSVPIALAGFAAGTAAVVFVE